MPRPRKCRRVCRLPVHTDFAPLHGGEGKETVILTVDEYEAIRLIDKEGLSQEECGTYMNIARTTVQQMYTTARRKLADALVDGLPLRIEGGDYCLCRGLEEGHCHRRGRQCPRIKTGGQMMKIAIPLDETKKNVCVSFGRAPYFLFAEDEKQEILENPAAEAQGGAGIKAAQFVADHGADTLITVRCGENAAEVFKAAGIKIYQSQAAGAAENLTALKEGKLAELTHFHAGFHGIQ